MYMPLLDGIKGTFDTVWSGIQSAIQAVVDIVGTVTSTIGEFKTFLDGLQSAQSVRGHRGCGTDGAGRYRQSGQRGERWRCRTAIHRRQEAGGTSYFRGGLSDCQRARL
jgi:hypothetical protein